MILEQFLNKKAKEIDNPIRNWGVGYTAEVINEWINLQIQAKKLTIPATEEEMKADVMKRINDLKDEYDRIRNYEYDKYENEWEAMDRKRNIEIVFYLLNIDFYEFDR